MGCDGGSIPKREELVKTKQEAEKPNQTSQMRAAWELCALSKQPLRQPIVGCLLGKLYNKITILEILTSKGDYGDADIICPHITKPKDFKQLNLTLNPDKGRQTSSLVTNISDTADHAQFICPITKKEMNGRSRFVFLWSCGCVVSESALKTINSTTCLVCNQPFKPEDVILINPTSEADIKTAQDRLASRPTKKRKRKSPELLAGSGSDEEKKKQKSEVKINMNLPDLKEAHEAAMKVNRSVKLFSNGKEEDKGGNYLTKGTFNRYAAC
ncbi:hypothetical protein HK103_006467 [Boothiomyces macroporosus]|uniref:Replication termination factor 2 n=1 Tax=Boothiomyces macroporosus TaxID=261099 RepID=A0AAD5UNA5_9FUNG|nr:hypothetical protein HK103_006467 [Boothiomyces macroporosus]